MNSIKNFDMHVTDTGKQVSFRRQGEPLTARTANCQIFIYHDVGIMYGIQGEDFFRAVHEHLDELFGLVSYFMGYVWAHHVAIYRHIGLDVEAHHTSIMEGEEVTWIIATRDADHTLLTKSGAGGTY